MYFKTMTLKNLVILFILLCFNLIAVSMLTACDGAVKLIIENKMQTDIVITHTAINKQGEQSPRGELGTVPSGQTEKLQYAIFLRQDVAGWEILLKAQDSSGMIVWQKRWSFEDFLKLKDVGWKIVVSPETSDPVDYTSSKVKDLRVQ